MSKPRIAVRGPKGRRQKELPVTVLSLRWALVRRLLLAVPVGLFLGGMLTNAVNLEPADPGFSEAMLGGTAVSLALFLTVLWFLGQSRRTAFAVAGGDPRAAGVLLFGVLKPRKRRTPSRGHAYGDGGYSSAGDAGGDCGGGDGGGGGCD